MKFLIGLLKYLYSLEETCASDMNFIILVCNSTKLFN